MYKNRSLTAVLPAYMHTYRYYTSAFISLQSSDRLVGLVVKASASSAADLGFHSRFCCGDISGSSHISDFIICTPVTTLPGAWHYRVRAGTGWPDVGIL